MESLKREHLYFRDDWTSAVEEVVRGAWQDEGFFKVQASVDARPVRNSQDEQSFSVTIHINEGKRYLLGDVSFREVPPSEPTVPRPPTAAPDGGEENNPDQYPARPTLRKVEQDMSVNPEAVEPPAVFPLEELRRTVDLHDGQVFSAKSIRAALDRLKKLYGSHGYIDFVATPLTMVDETNQRISLIFEMDPEQQFHWRKIDLLGLDPRAQAGLTWPFKPGEIFNNDIFESFLKLNEALLPPDVSAADVQVRRNVRAGTVDVLYDLRPCPVVPDE